MSMPISHGPAQSRLHRNWLLLARVLWVVVTVLVLGLDLAGAPVAYQQAHHICTSGSCDFQLKQAQADQLQALGHALDFYAIFVVCLESLATLVYAALGAIIFWRRSDDTVALLGAFMLVTFGGAAFNGTMAALPYANPAWTLPTMLLNAIGQVAFYAFFCVFPSGRFVPRWTIWVTLVWAAVWIVQLFPNTPAAAVGQFLNSGFAFIAIILLPIAAQVYRYRYASTPIQRQQTKWVVFGFVTGVGGFLILLTLGTILLPASQRENVQGMLILTTLVYLFLLLIPIAIALAILRSQLWEIDILINRALVYGTLTALLAAVYVMLTIGLERLAIAITGTSTQKPFFIVAATLAIAALFQPLRVRIQSTIDRRFYRHKYDAAKTLAAFTSALRQEIDLNDLSTELIDVVDKTMQPAHVSLWLRFADRKPAREAASTAPRSGE